MYRPSIFMAIVLALASCQKEDSNNTEPSLEPEAIVFSKESGSYAAVQLPYRKAEINASLSVPPIIVLYLHGGSAKGSDNESQLKEPGVISISEYLRDNGMRAIMLVPQCPSDKSWGAIMNRPLKALLDKYKTSSSKVYCFGGSMGGSGTWNLVNANPSYFAGAMPVAGNPSSCIASNFASTRVFAVMGTADTIMSYETVKTFTDEIGAASGTCKYELEDGWSHQDVCEKSYTTSRLKWVFE